MNKELPAETPENVREIFEFSKMRCEQLEDERKKEYPSNFMPDHTALRQVFRYRVNYVDMGVLFKHLLLLVDRVEALEAKLDKREQNIEARAEE